MSAEAFVQELINSNKVVVFSKSYCPYSKVTLAPRSRTFYSGMHRARESAILCDSIRHEIR